ncbi:MAG: FGGY-family carbohydrate kinase [Planctomycetia bacterium]
MLLATIFNLKMGSDELDRQGYPRTEIVLSGGLTKTPALGQILADAFNTPVVILDGAAEGTAWGAALMAKYRGLSIAGRAPARHAQARLVVHEGQGEQAATVVGGGEQLRNDGREGVAAARAVHPAEHLHHRVHRCGAVPQEDHVDRLAVGRAEVVDCAGDALERPVAHGVGDDARAEAHRHHARGADQRSGERRRLVAFRRCHRDPGRQAEHGRAVAVEHAGILAGSPAASASYSSSRWRPSAFSEQPASQ